MKPEAPLDPQKDLLDLLRVQMPFGKYKGRLLADLPEPYLVWFYAKGLPPGRIGHLMGLIYEIKLNGLEHLLTPLREKRPPRGRK